MTDETADYDGLDILDDFDGKLAGDIGTSVQISTKAHVLAVDDGRRCARLSVSSEAALTDRSEVCGITSTSKPC